MILWNPFCFVFCVKFTLGIPLLYGKQRKKRSVWHLYGPGWFKLFDGVYHYTCSHGLQPWVWCLTTPQAYSISTTCTLLHYIRVSLVRLLILWVLTSTRKYLTSVLLYWLHSFPAFCCQDKRFTNLWEDS
jgi:hypothetical protein